MIFGWLKRKKKPEDSFSELEYGYLPVCYKELTEHQKTIQNILDKIDEIRALIHEMKEADNDNKSTKNR